MISTDRSPTEHRVTLRLLSITDLHGHVLDWDYFRDVPGGASSLMHLVPLIEQARSETLGPCLLCDSGDSLQGTLLTDWAAQDSMEETHPVIDAMSCVGVDVACLGNHDFNYGLERLRRTLAGATFPVVASNIHGEATGAQRHVLLGAGPLQVGVFGLVPPQILDWDARLLRDRLTVDSMVETASEVASELRQLGADVVVALVHSGYGEIDARPGMENALHPLSRLSGIDAILAGHAHDLHPTHDEERTRPVVMAGCWGSHLGVLDITLERAASATPWRVVQTDSSLRAAAKVAPKEDSHGLRRTLARAHAATLEMARSPICESSVPLYTYFAQVGPCRAIDLIGASHIEAITARLEGGPYADLPVLAAVSPYKAGGPGGPEHYADVPAGTITVRHTASLYPFTNAFSGVLATGAQLRHWLERAAGQFLTVPQGARDAALLDPRFPSYNFDVLVGATYTLDLTQPALSKETPTTGRVKDLRVAGQTVADSDRFVIATNSYRLSGAGGFEAWPAEHWLVSESTPSRDLVVDHLLQAKTLDFTAKRWFTLTAGGESTTVLSVGPGARIYAEDAAIVGLRRTDRTSNGFDIWQMAL